ncbi:MAG: hypothetical protein VX780_00885 [Pseudomonadota bacterium]|nr:hypothetical protein [Pseudomonadota bacterium]
MAVTEPSKEKRYWLDDKKNVNKVWYSLIIICAITVICDFFYHKHVEFAVEDIIPGMYGWYGFLGCVFLVLAAKGLRKLLMRSETFYENNEND